jgi:hypothetical protein
VFGVNYSIAFKLFIALLLPLTIVWKLTATPHASSSDELKDKLVEFLINHQFHVAVLEEWIDYMPIISASNGTCRMLILKVSPDGWQRDLVHARAQNRRLFFVFRGKIYPDQPIWLTAATYLWSRELQKIGLTLNIAPVIAVIAPELCGAERLPWDELHESGAL